MTHSHSLHQRQKRALQYALFLTSLFCLVEFFGGIFTKSLALISDAAHMFTDAAALAMSYVALIISQKKADHLRTFGYYRFEILAAVFNASLLLVVAFYIAIEAYQRLVSPEPIFSQSVLLIAVVGLMVNLISIRLLHQEQHHNMNFKSAYLEVWSDALGSLGVILSALLIQFFRWYWVDSLVAVLIAVWILPRTWCLLKASIHILLEGVPEGINLHSLEQDFLSLQGVKAVHELHVWALSQNKISLTAHVVLDCAYDREESLSRLNAMLLEKYNILHTTLQLEYKDCEQSHACVLF